MANGASVREQGSDRSFDARREARPPYLYPDYVATCLRAPKKPRMILPRTLSDTTGPAFVHGLVGKLDKDLTRQHSGEPLGERIIVTGRLTDGDGLFSFVRVNPGSVPDGSLQAPHVMVSVFARGLLKRLVTRIYFPDESDSNARDPVLSSMEDPEFRKTLVAHEEGGALRLDVHLQGDHQTAFFEL